MDDLTNKDLDDLFDKTFSPKMSWQEISDKLCSMDNEHINDLRSIFCDRILDFGIRGGYRWAKDLRNYVTGSWIELFLKQTGFISSKVPFYVAVSAFFKEDYNECLRLLDEIYSDTEVFTTYIIDFSLFPVFKNAFPGFWQHIRELVQKKKSEPGVIEFIDAIEAYYDNTSFDVKIEKLSKVYQIDSKCVTIKELLAHIYAKNKMWNNAIAYYEQLDEPYILYFDDLYFDMAWAYDKARKYDQSIKYYKKCIEVNTNYAYANNNLGNIYIKKRKYNEAIITLTKCLNEKFTYEERKLASNNLVRAYIGAKKITEARAFATESKIKLWKDTLDRLEKAEAGESITEETEAEDKEKFSIASKGYSEIRASQFSSERILEDELVLRIESGQPVFGESLKIYQRKGKYGRQYIIPIGRLDLLAEDKKGNLYIIELKKDSGYDDAYKQITAYIEWFEQNKEFPDQEIYGIICLNNPSESLIKKTAIDARIKLYEYIISYREIK